MASRRHGFTLMEIMVVVIIVGVLAAAVMPIMRGRVERAKWAEANAAAGMIKNAVKVYFAEAGTGITGSLGQGITMNLLSIQASDLNGTYFVAGDYTIDEVNESGIATITVTGSLPNAPEGSKTLSPDGTWE